MKAARTLHFSLPAIVLLVGMAVIASHYYRNQQRRTNRVLGNLRTDAYTEGTRLSGLAQHLFRKNLRYTADLELSYLSAAPELDLGVIVDGGGIIRHSTHLEWKGASLKESPLAAAAGALERVRASLAGVVEESPDTKELFSVFPFRERDGRSIGAVILAYDLEGPIQQARKEAISETVPQALALLAGCVLLWFLLDVMVTSRVDRILDYSHEVLAGRKSPMTVTGNDEIGAVAQGFSKTVEILHHTELALLEASERAHRRIGMDLHDDVCQRITAAQLKAGILGAVLKNEGSAKAGMAVAMADDLASAALVARGFARGLAPVSLDKEGLSTALEELAEYLSKSFDLKCTVQCDLNGCEPPAEVQTHLYRIAQELATNAAKHSGGKRIDIRCRTTADTLNLEVENDGKSFNHMDGNNGDGYTGLGLHFVMQRVRALDGHLIYSRPGTGGTLARCIVPLSALKNRT